MRLRTRLLVLALLPIAPAASQGARAEAPCAPVISDPAGDEQPGWFPYSFAVPDSPDDAADVLDLLLSSDEYALTIVLRMSGLEPRHSSNSVDYQIRWDRHGATQYIEVVRGEDGWSATAWNGIPAASFDAQSATVRVDIARAGSDLPDGALLENIHVLTAVEPNPPFASWRDDAPDDYYGTGGSFEMGTSCSLPFDQRCPVVTDAHSDVHLFQRSREFRRDEPALDLLSVGATTDATRLVLSARVADPGAALPPGTQSVGWTISWVSGGVHWYGQVELLADGNARYTYGADHYNSWGTPVGNQNFGGHPASGSLDFDGGVMTIAVARSAVGMPADGDLVRSLAASSWLRSATVFNWPLTDVTEGGLWRVGDSCPAA